MNKTQKRGAILLLVGALLVLCAMGIHLIQKRQDDLAGQTATLLLQQLEQNVPSPETEEEDAEPRQDPKLPEKKYMGYDLIGSISIPSVGIHLPVLDDWSEEMLEVAPCRYQGSISGGNMIIMGHNYKSHFTPLQKVSVGAEVVFENITGNVFRYRVAEIAYLHRTQGEDLPSEYPLTVFTCTPGGLKRIIVRCEAIV